MKVFLVLLFLVVLFCGYYGHAKTAYSENSSHGQKCSWPIRFDSLILDISGMDWRRLT